MAQQTSNLKTHFENLSYDSAKILSEFKNSIHYNRFFNNLEYLNENATFVKFNSYNWNMRPDIFCNDHYKDSNLFPIILLVNNVGTIFDFMPDKFFQETIIAPNKNSIIKVLSIK